MFFVIGCQPDAAFGRIREYMDATDESLVIGLRGGNSAFLRELFRRHASGLLAYQTTRPI